MSVLGEAKGGICFEPGMKTMASLLSDSDIGNIAVYNGQQSKLPLLASRRPTYKPLR